MSAQIQHTTILGVTIVYAARYTKSSLCAVDMLIVFQHDDHSDCTNTSYMFP